jgi:glucose-6-phosphate 1-dehydrogenase
MMHETLVLRTGEAARGAAPAGEPCLLVLFGASGDLTKRLLMPALYNLACDGLLPRHFALVGMALDELTTEQFRARMSADIKTFTTRATFDARVWDDFVARLHYTPGDFGDLAAFQRLAELAAGLEAKFQTGGNVLFYLAVPPAVFGLISVNLDKAGFKSREKGWTRLIVEKPFGHDLASAVALNQTLLTHWSEDQIYRIDHYLGKETVQNILVLRLANGILEPVWNRRYVDHVQILVAESIGVAGRGAYYERAGALRDVVQNHMFQLLALVAMEPPISFRAEDVHNEKVKVLRAVRPLSAEDVLQHAVRGQYGPGFEGETPLPGYRDEPRVQPDSRTETYAALELFIENWRWAGVPFYLRTGKRLPARNTQIVIEFKRAPLLLFRQTALEAVEPNRLLLRLQPDEGISLQLKARVPGPTMRARSVDLTFDYRDLGEQSPSTGYETLLYDCMRGDSTLFHRSDLIEAAWEIATPLLEVWESLPPRDFPNYAAGSWGPEAARPLIERGGRRWVNPGAPQS